MTKLEKWIYETETKFYNLDGYSSFHTTKMMMKIKAEEEKLLFM